MTQTATNKSRVAVSNPLIKKMRENSSAFEYREEDRATYGGIGAKTVYFLLICVVGVISYFVLNSFFKGQGMQLIEYSDPEKYPIFDIRVYLPEIFIGVGALAVSIFLPLLAWLIRPAIPVFGTLYCLMEGYVIGFITGLLRDEFDWASVLAFVLTVALVLVAYFLYSKGIVKVNHRFKTFLAVAFGTIILGGMLMAILYFIPFTNSIIAPILTFMDSPIPSIILSVVYIIIATLFLLVDFDNIRETVEGGCSRKLEWIAAWGLAYTIIYIYFKILDLIIKILSLMGKGSKK